MCSEGIDSVSFPYVALSYASTVGYRNYQDICLLLVDPVLGVEFFFPWSILTAKVLSGFVSDNPAVFREHKNVQSSPTTS